jgi:hypothetical protein
VHRRPDGLSGPPDSFRPAVRTTIPLYLKDSYQKDKLLTIILFKKAVFLIKFLVIYAKVLYTVIDESIEIVTSAFNCEGTEPLPSATVQNAAGWAG